MSLDVHLSGEKEVIERECEHCGKHHHCREVEGSYWANITHNLGAMAKEAGIYDYLWRPEEIGATKAKHLVGPLRVGLSLLKSDPARFQKHNAPNGWGMYEHFVPFVEEYLAACEASPESDVTVSR